MKTIACFYLMLALLPSVLAAVNPTPPAAPVTALKPPSAPSPAALVITGDNDSHSLNVSSLQSAEVKLRLRNVSDHEITVTDFGFNSPAVLAPIAPIVLAPGAAGSFSLHIDGRLMPLPSNARVFFRAHDAKSENLSSAQFTLTSRDIFILEPKYVLWRSGEPTKPKTVRIVQSPPGTKITGVKSSSPDFTATLDGSNIVITPADTSKPHNAAVSLACEPASPQSVFVTMAVLPAATNPTTQLPAPSKPVPQGGSSRPTSATSPAGSSPPAPAAPAPGQ